MAAERAEREHINRLKEEIRNQKPKGEPKREPPKFEEFAKTFLEISETRNKPFSIEAKESILRVHLTPIFGRKPIDQIGFTEIQDYITSKTKVGLSKKTINNHLTVLRRLLVVAKKRALIEVVPEIEWLRVPEQDFDYLDFGEAQRLIDSADEGWRPMITVAIKTGLRLGELLALRWREDVDLVKGQIVVRQSVTRGIVTTPKSGKKREVDLGDEAIAALKSARHLRGPLVFCSADGRMMGKNEVKHPLWRACRKAGLRQIGWARPSAHVRLASRDARRAAEGDPGTAGPRDDRNDDEVFASEPRYAAGRGADARLAADERPWLGLARTWLSRLITSRPPRGLASRARAVGGRGGPGRGRASRVLRYF